MKAIIVSDLHLGYRNFLSRHLEEFLRNLPEGYDLVLNGDVTDRSYQGLSPSRKQILDLIREESFRRKVVWVHGNNDNSFVLPEPGEIRFKRIHTMGKQLLIVHGDLFDKIRDRSRIFVKMLRFTYSIGVRLGIKPANLTDLALNFEVFYRFYRRQLMQNAVHYARQNGFEAVTCGHTHYAEDMVTNGIRYINTGTWTKHPPYYLLVNNGEMTLKTAHESIPGACGRAKLTD